MVSGAGEWAVDSAAAIGDGGETSQLSVGSD